MITIGHTKRGGGILLIVLMLVTGTIMYDASTVYNIEQTKREQARDNLQNIKHCLYMVEPDMDRRKSLETCVAKSKISFTGDAYVLDVNTLEFIYDPSKDVPIVGPVYFTKESVGQYFEDWESGHKALKVMLLGKDSRKDIDAFYYFNDSPEWLEWVYLPDEYGALYLIVQGIQKDEVMTRFNFSRYTWFGLILITCICLLALNSRRRTNDRIRDNYGDVCPWKS